MILIGLQLDCSHWILDVNPIPGVPACWLLGLLVPEHCGGGVRGGWGAEGMIGGAQLSVEKMEAQFTQPAGVETHIWVSKI